MADVVSRRGGEWGATVPCCSLLPREHVGGRGGGHHFRRAAVRPHGAGGSIWMRYLFGVFFWVGVLWGVRVRGSSLPAARRRTVTGKGNLIPKTLISARHGPRTLTGELGFEMNKLYGYQVGARLVY